MSNANEENNGFNTNNDDSNQNGFSELEISGAPEEDSDPFASDGGMSDAESASSSFSPSIETDDAFGGTGALEADVEPQEAAPNLENNNSNEEDDSSVFNTNTVNANESHPLESQNSEDNGGSFEAPAPETGTTAEDALPDENKKDSQEAAVFDQASGAPEDDSDPFGDKMPAPKTEITAEDALPDENKKGKAKKEKAPKVKKEKAPKVKKEKTPKAKKAKAPKSVASHGSSKPFVVLGAVFLLGILVANAVALMTAGAASIMFLACFDVLGLLLLAIPALLIKQLRTRAVGLFDVFIALAAAFVVMAAMAVLAQQAKNYGASSKVASNVAVSSFDVRA